MEKADRQFENMRIVARERLLRHTPQEVSRKAGVRYEDGMYLVDTLGKTVSVRLPDCTVLPQLSNWHTLTLLHYLDLADGAPPSGCMISFSQYKDGLVRGGGLDRNAELIVRRDLGVLPPEELARRCLSMGAELLPSNADFCAHFSFLPRCSLWLKVWFADDELPPSGRAAFQNQQIVRAEQNRRQYARERGGRTLLHAADIQLPRLPTRKQDRTD